MNKLGKHKHNQFGRFDFSFGSVVNTLKERQRFPDQINRSRFYLILARYYWNYVAIDNLICLNSVVNEII